MSVVRWWGLCRSTSGVGVVFCWFPCATTFLSDNHPGPLWYLFPINHSRLAHSAASLPPRVITKESLSISEADHHTSWSPESRPTYQGCLSFGYVVLLTYCATLPRQTLSLVSLSDLQLLYHVHNNRTFQHNQLTQSYNSKEKTACKPIRPVSCSMRWSY